MISVANCDFSAMSPHLTLPCMLIAMVQHISKGYWGLGERLPEFQAACKAPSIARWIVLITFTSTWLPEADSHSSETED